MGGCHPLLVTEHQTLRVNCSFKCCYYIGISFAECDFGAHVLSRDVASCITFKWRVSSYLPAVLLQRGVQSFGLAQQHVPVRRSVGAFCFV